METELKKRSPYPLLHSKLNPPIAGRSLVQRKQLIEWMQSSKHVKLVTVRAPAGFGKTTLLAQWMSRLREQKLPAAWLTLDEADNDAGRFLFNLFSALQENVPEFIIHEPEKDYSELGRDPTGGILHLLDRLSSFEQPVPGRLLPSPNAAGPVRPLGFAAYRSYSFE